MPVNKSALIRYRIIDSCLTNTLRKYPTLEFIKEKIDELIDANISESMINKDFAAMKEIYNAPIRYNRYNKGYCYSENDFSIREFPLTADEIEALDFSTALLNQLKGTSLFVQFESAINKVIEGYRISKIIGKSEKQILQVEEPIKTEANKWLEKILRAILTKDCLDVTYQGFDKSQKVHEFSPYLLKEYRNRWYAVGYSQKPKDVLVFALDRIKEIRQSKEKYHSNAEFKPEEYFKYSLGITQFNNTEPDTVILSYSPAEARYILSQPLHHTQEVILENEEEVQIKMQLYLTQELLMMILSYGSSVEVIAPEKLRVRIKEMLEQTIKIYS